MRKLPYNFPAIQKEERENSILEFVALLLFIIGAVCAILMLVVDSQRKIARKTSRRRLAASKDRTSEEFTERYVYLDKNKYHEYS